MRQWRPTIIWAKAVSSELVLEPSNNPLAIHSGCVDVPPWACQLSQVCRKSCEPPAVIATPSPVIIATPGARYRAQWRRTVPHTIAIWRTQSSCALAHPARTAEILAYQHVKLLRFSRNERPENGTNLKTIKMQALVSE
jgi:hypothetical protein